MHRRIGVLTTIALACLAAAPAPARACVADTFTVDRLASESAYVVTATVTEVRSYWTPDHMTIETAVTLSGVERITREGAIAEPDITYTTVGGTVGDATLRICCMPEMRAGERWVLFLQREYRQSPVLGMERGMFRIAQLEGEAARVRTSGGEPVATIAADGAVTVAPASQVQAQEAPVARRPLSVRGSISAVRVAEAPLADAGPVSPGLTLDDFLAQVRLRLPQDHARGEGERAGAGIAITRIAAPMAPVKLRATIHQEENPEVAK